MLSPTNLWVPGQVGKLKRPVTWENILSPILCMSSEPSRLLSRDMCCSSWIESLSLKGSRVAVQHVGAGEAGGGACWVSRWSQMVLGPGRSALGPGFPYF